MAVARELLSASRAPRARRDLSRRRGIPPLSSPSLTKEIRGLRRRSASGLWIDRVVGDGSPLAPPSRYHFVRRNSFARSKPRGDRSASGY